MASMAAPPTRCWLLEMANPKREAAASRIRRASVMTSGPMPSPARMVMRCVRDMRRTLAAGLSPGKAGNRRLAARIGWSAQSWQFSALIEKWASCP